MKRFIWIVLIVFVFALAACAPKTEHKSAITSKQVIEQAQKALETLQAYLEQQKEMHIKGAEAKLQRLDRRIGILESKADTLGEEVKAKLLKQIEVFKGKEEAFKAKIEKMQAEPEASWEKMVGEIVSAMNDLENEFDKVLENL